MPQLNTIQKALYMPFDRDSWSKLRKSVPLTLQEADLAELRGINEQVSLDEVTDIYLPLSRLLNLIVRNNQQRGEVLNQFLGQPPARSPYIISIAGSVAVGKSTTARILQALLSHWPEHPKVDLITTDGFLYPLAELKRRNLLNRKGFPESYDTKLLVDFISAVKAGEEEVDAPLYSHIIYDRLEDVIKVRQPDILILEGLNVLQTELDSPKRRFVSDFVDFSIYVDADESNLRQWYVERFLKLRKSAFADPCSYFSHFASLTDDAATAMANDIWDGINGPNLTQNILPTRERAHLILKKGAHHSMEQVLLRK
ncbi:type I pantothenate kinase [Shewanella sp. C32]|uniref:Pantothenate kinase n=1 Tax=Shewanella electrica TaxID=515560 RepID=A0ABT2FNI2_9GAMM|nr:type I pantothenate kinase [Shewanella electrica]MCH1926339.1 type I pantothenate kinase [Shewanella electrica]MCS4557890.1 type I pantothenate kinase [Shewanella electrica]